MVHKPFLLLTMLSVLGCNSRDTGISRQQYDAKVKEVEALRQEVQELRKTVEELKTGPSRRLAEANTAFNDGNFEQAKTVAQDLISKHAQSAEAVQARALVGRAESAIRAAVIAKARALEQAMAGMAKKRDEMRNLTVWRDRAMPAYVNSRSWVGAYIMVPDAGPPTLRFVVYYTADDWLFIERYLFMVDGITFHLTPEKYGANAIERDNGSGDIWEWWDVRAEGETLSVLEALSRAKNATMRYEGKQYRKDRIIGAAERDAARRTLAAYVVLKNRS